MTDRLTYKNEDKFYLKWGVDQELDKLSTEVQEVVRAAIEKLGKYEDDEKFIADRDNNAEWQSLVKNAEVSYELYSKTDDKYRELRRAIIAIRSDYIPYEELDTWVDDSRSYEECICEEIRKRLEELKELKEKPKKPSKNWIFNRFGQR